MKSISPEIKTKIDKALGFQSVFVSSNIFRAHDENRIRYTMKRPNGTKLYHLIGYESGDVVSC